MGTNHGGVNFGRRLPPIGGQYSTPINNLARIEVLVLDDWGLAPIDAARARDLLEILDDRFGRRSAIVTSQLPVAEWH